MESKLKIKRVLNLTQDVVKDFGITKACIYMNEIRDKKMSRVILSNKLNQEINSHHLQFEEFLQLLFVLEKQNGSHLSLINELLSLFNLKCVTLTKNDTEEVSYKTILNALIDWDKESGDVHNEIHDSLSDGVVTSNELKRIKKEMNQDIEAMTRLKDMLEKIAESNKKIV